MTTTQTVSLVVADHAQSVEDCRLLLNMLGLLPEDVTPAAARPDRAVVSNTHGSMRRYVAGCRCDACRAKNAGEKRKTRKRAKADPARADRAGHGKANTYKNHGCRCESCCAAHAAWMADYHKARKQAAA